MLTVQLYRGDNQLRASLSCVDLQCRLIICCHLPDEFNSTMCNATCARRLKKTGVRVLLESNMFGLSDQLSFVESPD